MRNATFATALAVTTAIAGSAYAGTVDPLDPLHGQCFSGTTLCAEYQSSITTIIGPGTPGFTGADWGFTISPGKGFSGQFDVLFAIPNNEVPAGSIGVSGTINGNPVSTNATSLAGWTSGEKHILDVPQVNALFPGASPANTFSNAIYFTQVSDPTATSYQLFVASFGSQILQDNSVASTVAGLQAAMDLSATLPIGTIILPFFDDTDPHNTGWVAAANSGTLWVDADSVTPPPPPPPPPPVPEPTSLALFGVGLLGLGAVARRRTT